jgi:ribosomal protein L16/L10AE
VKRGTTLFEVDGLPSFVVYDAFNAATKKLAVKTFIYESRWKTNKKI